MLNWFKRLLGVEPAQPKQEPLVLETPVEKPAEKPKKATTSKPKTTTPKKSTTKKAPAATTTEAPKKRGRPKKTDS